MSLATESIIRHAGDIRAAEEARGVAATRGHVSGQMGLRGHSVGGVFPCVMYTQGKPEALTYWFISPDSARHGPYPDWLTAEGEALAWLENREV